jgi:hypothetical protein
MDAEARIVCGPVVEMGVSYESDGLGELCFRRVVVIGGATAAVIVALLFVKPFYSASTAKVLSSTDVSQTVADQASATETASIVASLTIDADPQLFVGCGDGSNGYYADPPLAFVRYEQMP